MEDAKYVPTVLHTVASEKLNNEVVEDLKKADPTDASIASFIESGSPQHNEKAE